MCFNLFITKKLVSEHLMVCLWFVGIDWNLSGYRNLYQCYESGLAEKEGSLGILVAGSII